MSHKITKVNQFSCLLKSKLYFIVLYTGVTFETGPIKIYFAPHSSSDNALLQSFQALIRSVDQDLGYL